MFIKRYKSIPLDCWQGTVYTHIRVRVMLIVANPTVTMTFITTVITQLFLYFHFCHCVK
jgi:hypothetical protein